MYFCQNDKHNYNTPFSRRICMNTMNSVKVSFKNKRIRGKKETYLMKFPEEETFKHKNYFGKNPLYFRVYSDAEHSCEHKNEQKGANTDNIYH